MRKRPSPETSTKPPYRLEKEVLVGGELRVGPSQGGRQAAQLWKFWTEGSDVYALQRVNRGTNKFSVHQSGQIHWRIQGKDKQPLAPPLSLGRGDWLHAFELRFLICPDALRPQPENLIGKRGFLIEVSSDSVLFLNLLVGRTGLQGIPDLPGELAGAKPLWRATLSDKRPVVLTARLLNMDEQNRKYIHHIRHELNPKANFIGPPVNPYFEIVHTHWDSKGGNVILVLPMGNEAIKVHKSSLTQSSAESRSFDVSTPSALAPITAPDGARVGALSISGGSTDVLLAKDGETRIVLGKVTLAMDPSSLRFGESFFTPTYLLRPAPNVEGKELNNPGYRVKFDFDGKELKARIAKTSGAFRNASFPEPVKGLRDDEELVVRVPFDSLVLQTTTDAPESTVLLEGGFLLRDI